MNKIVYFLLLGLFSLILSGCTGDGKSNRTQGDSNGTSSRTIRASIQSVFDEAAKGPGTTDLKRLNTIYTEVVIDKAKGKELLNLNKNGDNFLCLLFKLPASKETRGIMHDLLSHRLEEPLLTMNSTCANSQRPIDLLLDPARSITDDDDEHLDKMITWFVGNGDNATIGVASDGRKLKKMLDAVQEYGDQPQMDKAINNIPAGVKGDVLAWVKDNDQNPKVKNAVQSVNLIDMDSLMVLLQQTTVDTDVLSFYYEKLIDADDKAKTLSKLGATPDRFAQLLARAPADAHTLAIWEDYLQKLLTHAESDGKDGEAAVLKQLKLSMSQTAPFAMMLNNPSSSAKKAEIIALMVEKGDEDMIRLANTEQMITAMLSAVLAEGLQEDMEKTIKRINFNVPELVKATVAWVKAHRDQKVSHGEADKDMQTILKDASDRRHVLILSLSSGLASANLRFFYELVVNDSTNEAIELQKLRTTMGNSFLHRVCSIEPSDNTEWIIDDFLTKLASSVPALATEALKQKNKSEYTPFAMMLNNPSSSAKKAEIIALMVEEGDEDMIRSANDTDMLHAMLDAVRDEYTDSLPYVIDNIDFSQGHLVKATVDWVRKNELTMAYADDGDETGKDMKAVLDSSETNNSPDGLLALATELLRTASGEKGLWDYNDIKTLNYFYRLVRLDHFGEKAKRFFKLLAMLPASKDTMEIMADFLNNLNDGVGDKASVLKNPGAVVEGDSDKPSPFVQMVNGDLRPEQDDDNSRQQIIALMVEKGDEDMIRLANTEQMITAMLDAVSVHGDDAMMKNVMEQGEPSLKMDLLAWVKSKADTNVGESTVSEIFSTCDMEINLLELTDAAQNTDGTKVSAINFLASLYDSYFQGLELTDREKAATDLADWNSKGTYSTGDVGDGFIHLLVSLPASELTKMMLEDFMKRAVAGGYALNALKEQENLAGFRAQDILTHGIEGTPRETGMLVNDDPKALQDMLNLVK